MVPLTNIGPYCFILLFSYKKLSFYNVKLSLTHMGYYDWLHYIYFNIVQTVSVFAWIIAFIFIIGLRSSSVETFVWNRIHC